MAISRTDQAIQRVKEGESVRSAARALDISPAAVYAQLKREQDKPLCPCCRQVVRDGFKINTAVLK